VNADDAGLVMAAGERPISAISRRQIGQPSRGDFSVRLVTQAIGRGLVVGIPWFLKALAATATAAPVWVSGGIVMHGLSS
jgi:predicted DNA repair protein MutK